MGHTAWAGQSPAWGAYTSWSCKLRRPQSNQTDTGKKESGSSWKCDIVWSVQCCVAGENERATAAAWWAGWCSSTWLDPWMKKELADMSSFATF